MDVDVVRSQVEVRPTEDLLVALAVDSRWPTALEKLSEYGLLRIARQWAILHREPNVRGQTTQVFCGDRSCHPKG